MQQTKVAAAATLLAAAGAPVASGVLTGLGRPLRLRARTERRHDQRVEGVDAWARMVAAGAEVCAQGEGVLACLLRWPIRRRDGRLGRHQQGRVRLDEQRGERELRPGRGSRRGL